MYIKFWGTRGSIPVPGQTTLKYGGNTPCVEIRTNNNQLIILDAGSGIRELGKYLSGNGYNDPINIIVSHYHWDHIQGIPFFLPLYDKKNKITFYGETSNGEKIKSILQNQMTSNYFPINLDEICANAAFEEIKINSSYNIANIRVETLRANHSSPTVTYKFIDGEKSIVYMTDNELKLKDSIDDSNKIDVNDIVELNKELIDFCYGCDYLIHDSMYDEISILGKKGWGHTGNVTLTYFSIIAKVKNLVLFHYNPDYSDEKIDNLLEKTITIAKGEGTELNCIASKEGMSIEF